MKRFLGNIIFFWFFSSANLFAQDFSYKKNRIIQCELCTTLYQKSKLDLSVISNEIAGIKEDYKVDTLASGIYASDYVFFIDAERSNIQLFYNNNHSAGYINYENILNALYRYFPDNYDFVLIMPGSLLIEETGFEATPFFLAVQNFVEGIGKKEYDFSKMYGSQGRLQGIVYHSYGSPSILAHELGHNWCSYLANVSVNSHWSPMTNIGGIMADLPQAYEYSEDNFKAITNFSTPEANRFFSNLDLYLMGLAGLEEVLPIKKIINPRYNGNLSIINYESIETTYSIDIPKTYGIRIPSSGDSPKIFSLAYIVVKEGAFTQSEFNFHFEWSKFSSLIGTYDIGSNYTFEKAAYGKAKLETKLKNNIPLYNFNNNINPGFNLSQNYPNPFNPVTFINFTIPENGNVTINIYDVLGEKVTTLIDEEKQAGSFRIYFDGSKFSSGVYIYKMEAGNFSEAKKLILLK